MSFTLGEVAGIRNSLNKLRDMMKSSNEKLQNLDDDFSTRNQSTNIVSREIIERQMESVVKDFSRIFQSNKVEEDSKLGNIEKKVDGTVAKCE